jgi:dsDNA-specific endonuclease/ATPase MutS2
MKASPLLDLHACQVSDVADRVDRFIVQQTAKGAAQVRIMSGKGTGQVKKAVIDYLKQGGFPYQHEKTEGGKVNEGVFVVFLD